MKKTKTITKEKRELLKDLLAKDGSAHPEIQRVPCDSTAPLLPTQFGIWYQCSLDPQTTAYNTPFEVRINGALDSRILENSLCEFIKRHEAMRTVFIFEDNAPRQKVLPPDLTEVKIETTDLSSLDPDERKKKSRELSLADSGTIFNVAEWPLFKARLKRLEPDLHILSLAIHHIIFDGWSKEIFIKELGEIYLAERDGRPPVLPLLSINHRDYSAWSARKLDEGLLAKELEYWRQRLSGELPAIALQLDRPRPASARQNPARVRVTIDKELKDKIAEVGLKNHATLYMTLLSAFYVLMGRYIGQDDLIIASTFAGRAHPEAEKIFGLFMNTLPLRADLAGDPSFTRLVAEVRASVLDAHENQHLAMENIVKGINTDRDALQNPLLKIVFQLNDVSRRKFEAPGLVITEAAPGPSVGLSDLFLNVTDAGDSLVCDFDYPANIFDSITIERMSRHYLTLLEGIIKEPGAKLSKLPMLTASERETMLKEWNHRPTRYPKDKCIQEIFEETTLLHSDSIAIEAKGKTVTYGELNRLANTLALRLKELGVSPGAVVAIETERSIEMVVSILGAVKAGAVYVPIDPELPLKRREHMLKDSGAIALLTFNIDNGLCLQAGRTLDPSIICNESIKETHKNPPCKRSIDSPICINYTSGSTGAPKGAISSNRNIMRIVLGTNNIEFFPTDAVGQCRGFSTDVLNFEVWGALLNGSRLAIIDHETLITPFALGSFIRERAITIMEVSSSLFNHVVKDDPSAFKALRYLGIGGESADPRFVKMALRHGPPAWFVNAYGPTECGVYSTYYRITDVDSDAVRIPIGKPISGDRAYILDRFMNPVPVGVAGELYLGGDGVGLGYLSKPELTAERFMPDPFSDEPGARIYRTGDVAKFLPDGDIDFLGRADHQIKIRGHRIEPGEIEALLNEDKAIAESLVVAIDATIDSASEKQLVAYVVPAKGHELDEAALRRHLADNLPAYMIPNHFIALETLPIEPGKKLDRSKLPLPERNRQKSAPAPFTPTPQSALEKKLVKIWEDVIGIKPVSTKDNFFEIGGHSLMAVRLFARIEKDLCIKLPLALFYKAPTIAELASNIAQNDRSSDWRPLVPIRPEGGKAPFFCVHPGGGNVLYYSNLGRHMDPARPLYALQASGLDGVSEPLQSIPEIADLYIKEIRSVRPVGPYHLGGLCMGALIALEMAQKLKAAGEKVGVVAVFDLWLAPELDSWMEETTDAPSALKYYWRGLLFQIKRGQLAKAVMRRLSAESKRLLRALNLSAIESKNILKVVEALLEARRAYIPKPYDGKITYLKTAGNHINSAWQKLALRGIDAINLPGDHAGILTEPYVRDLATLLNSALDDFEKGNI